MATERAIVVKKKGFSGVYMKCYMKNGQRIPETEFFMIAKYIEDKYQKSTVLNDPVLILSTIFFTCTCNSHDNFKFTPFDDRIDDKYRENKIKQIESYIYNLYLFNQATPFFVSGNPLYKDDIMSMISVISKVLKNETHEVDFSSVPFAKCYFSDAFFISILIKDVLEKRGWNFFSCIPYNDPYTAIIFSIML